MITRTLRANGFEFDLSDRGPGDDAEPVLALHGFPTTSRSWDLVADRVVTAGRRFLAFDQRGYSPGARPDGVEQYTQDHLVRDVIGVLDALDLERVHLVGHDWGGAVAWAVAAAHPGRLRSLTVASTPHPTPFGEALRSDPEQQRASAYMEFFRTPQAEPALLKDDARALRDVWTDGIPGELVEAYLARMREPGALTGGLNWYRATADGLGPCGPVTVPTTYIWGARDSALRGGPAHATADQVQAPYRFVELPEANHWLPETAPDVIAEAVLDPPH